VIFIGKEIIELEEPYTDYHKILRNDFGFALDLGQCLPVNEQAKLYTRIITTHLVANQSWN